MAAPIETKVTVASVAAFLSSEALGELAVLLGAPVPAWAVQLVTGAITGLVTLAAGWLAKHTPRGVETAPPPVRFLQPAMSVGQAAEIMDRWLAAQPPGYLGSATPTTTADLPATPPVTPKGGPDVPAQ